MKTQSIITTITAARFWRTHLGMIIWVRVLCLATGGRNAAAGAAAAAKIFFAEPDIAEALRPLEEAVPVPGPNTSGDGAEAAADVLLIPSSDPIRLEVHTLFISTLDINAPAFFLFTLAP
jgi:hypothetical protein